VSAPAPPWGRQQPPPWRNVRVRRIAIQVVFLAAVIASLGYLYGNVTSNLRRLGISTSFAWLDQPAGIPLAYSDIQPSDSYLAAILAGVRNTALVAVLGIVLATIIGVLVGVGRLSSNWLVRQAASVFVEALRNIPVLLIILFFYLAIFLQAPPLRDAFELGDLVVLSVRGLVIPWFETTGDLGLFLALLAAAVVVAVAVGIWRTRLFERTGRPHHRLAWIGGTLLLGVVVAYVAGGRPLMLSLPERGEFATEAGLRLGPEYAALLVGLTLYTASHIAEIARGSILAVPRGQVEAGTALGLSGAQRLRHVVLPQAMRIMIPPLANQYLNLIKNSSLGVAVAFPEVTQVIKIAIGQAAPAPQAIALLMLVYLAFSLVTSLLMNLYNWRISRRGAR
jgi:general L-amino acid transport system permease protein